MANIQVIVTIKGGAGEVILTKAGIPDIIISSSGTSNLSLSTGDHYIMVGAIPPDDGTIEISFHQDDTSLASHTYKSPKTIPFLLEVS